MIYITGDTHGELDINKLSSKKFPEGNALTRDDYLIICGDFGLVWDGSPEEMYWRKWLEDKPWTTLWIDGNHENYDMLEQFPVEEWNGVRVQYITDHVIHILRGQVFQLEGLHFFAFGGAESHDREYRLPGVSWWEDEMPSQAEMEMGRKSLDTVKWKVDIVITHSFPQKIQDEVFRGMGYGNNALTRYFDEIRCRLKYRLWFSGHYHISGSYDERHQLIYNAVVKLNDSTTGYEVVRAD